MSRDAAWLAELSVAIRKSTLKRLRSVPVGCENWRPTEDALSFTDIAQHLIECDEWLFRKLADPQLRGIQAQRSTAAVANRAHFDSLVSRLAALGDRRSKFLAGLATPQLKALIDDDRFGGAVSVWWVVARGNLDHEAHHRGQLATYLRILGSRGFL